MNRVRFGTDGVRGVANADLTPELAFTIGLAAGRFVAESGAPRRAIIGRDTRRSGPMLGAAVAAGLCSAGIDVETLGVAPTGAVSHATRTGGFGLGVVVSASHNPAPDNGIKLLAPSGGKLPTAGESRIASLVESMAPRPTGAAVGWLGAASGERERYEHDLAALVPERLEGMRIAVDAANGAAFDWAASLFESLGASVDAVGNQPDGMNINVDCGATNPARIQSLTRELGADVGVAFDGDADRAVFADSEGRLINGDRTLALWCDHWREAGRVGVPIVVGTVMTNGALDGYLRERGIELVRAAVGDRNVSHSMAERGAPIGGEQSGHLIFADFGPTGDGLVTALEFFRVLRRAGRTAAEAFAAFEPWPQLMVNVATEVGADVGDLGLASAQRAAEDLVGAHGRVLVRPSGTQPMIRVMVECVDAARRDEAASLLVERVLESSGGHVYSRVDLTYALGD